MIYADFLNKRLLVLVQHSRERELTVFYRNKSSALDVRHQEYLTRRGFKVFHLKLDYDLLPIANPFIDIKNEKEAIVHRAFPNRPGVPDEPGLFYTRKFFVDHIGKMVEIKAILEKLDQLENASAIFLNYPNLLKRLKPNDPGYKKFIFYQCKEEPDYEFERYSRRFNHPELEREPARILRKCFDIARSIQVVSGKAFKERLRPFRGVSVLHISEPPELRKSETDFLQWVPGSHCHFDPRNSTVNVQGFSAPFYILDRRGLVAYTAFLFFQFIRIQCKYANSWLSFPTTVAMLKDWFFIRTWYNRLEPKFFFALFDVSSIYVFFYLARKSPAMVSMASTWSLPGFHEYGLVYNYGGDVFLGWGSAYAELLRASYDSSRFLVKIGYIGGSEFQTNPEEIKKFREDYPDDNRTRVVFFDNVFAQNHWMTENLIQKIFSAFADLLREKKIYLFLKMKKALHLKKYPVAVRRILDEYSADICISTLPKDHRFFSVADLVVGQSWSSLAFISGIQGIPAWLCDDTIVPENISEKCKLVKLVAPEELTKELYAFHRNEASRKPQKCDFVDPFADGAAQRRIAEYINSISNGDENLSRDERLVNANRLYCSIWGDDTVIPLWPMN